MTLFISGVVSGVAVGLLYALLGFSVNLLYKSTGVANFAVGILATLGAFFVYWLLGFGVGLYLAVLVTLPLMALVGAVVYYTSIRPLDSAGHLNLTMRTFGVYLVIVAILQATWAQGQPFSFPAVFSIRTAFRVGEINVSWLTVGTVIVAAVLASAFIVFFRFTTLGFAFLALAERPEIGRLLGLPTRRMTLIAWVMACLVALVVGILVAPSAQLSVDMLEPYLLIAFSAAVIGGLTSLAGVFVSGIVLGILSNVIALYSSADLGVLAIFGALVLSLIMRPSGLFGAPVAERL